MANKLAKISKEAYDAIVIGVDNSHPVSNLEQLGISQRMINLLQSNNINELGDLVSKKTEDLMSLQNFGERQLHLLFEALSKYHSIQD